MKFMTLWTDDFIAGTHPLSPEERGVYITLICHFINKDRVIKDDDIYLARLCNVTTRAYRRIKKSLIEGDFLEVKDGHIWNDKASNQYKKDQSFSKNQAKKAKLKSRSKLGKLLETNNSGYAGANPPLPLPLPLSEDSPIPPKGDLFNDQFDEFWKEWRKKVRKEKSKAALSKALKVASFDKIMQGLRIYNQSLIDTPSKFYANAVTWLNEKRWNDEVDPVRDGTIPTRNADLTTQRGRWMAAHQKWVAEGRQGPQPQEKDF